MTAAVDDWWRLMQGRRPLEIFRLYREPIWMDIHRRSYPRKKWRGHYVAASLKRTKAGTKWCAR